MAVTIRKVRFIAAEIEVPSPAREKADLPLADVGFLLIGMVLIVGYFTDVGRTLLALVSVVGSMIVAWAVFASNRQQDQIKTTLDMHRDYYSAQLGGKREDAIKFFKLYHRNDWTKDDPYEVKDPESKRDGYSEVLRFFHRLAILNDHDRLDRAMVTDLFSRELGFWWGFAFCRMKKRANWWTGPMVYRLARQLCEQGGWATFRQGYRSGRKLRLHGDIRVMSWTGKIKKRPRPKSKALPVVPPTQHWL